MSYETTQAIQAVLEGVGTVLLPATPEDPPSFVTKTYIDEARADWMRVFPAPNPHGPVFHYRFSEHDKGWFLKDESN